MVMNGIMTDGAVRKSHKTLFFLTPTGRVSRLVDGAFCSNEHALFFFFFNPRGVPQWGSRGGRCLICPVSATRPSRLHGHGVTVQPWLLIAPPPVPLTRRGPAALVGVRCISLFCGRDKPPGQYGGRLRGGFSQRFVIMGSAHFMPHTMDPTWFS